MAQGVVHHLEAVHVQEQGGERLAVAPGVDDGLAQTVLEQGPVRQAGEQVVVGLEGDGGLRLLALADVPGDTVAADEHPFLAARVPVHAHGRELHRHAVLAGGLGQAAQQVFLALELELEIARGALAGAALVDAVAGVVHLARGHQQQVVLAHQFLGAVAQGAADAVVDVGDHALGVQGVDDVGRGVDQEPVPVLGLFQLLEHACVVLLQLQLADRVAHGLDQLVGLVGLAQVVIGAQAQGQDGRFDVVVAAHDDDPALGLVLSNVGHDVVAAGIGQVQVDQGQVVMTLAQAREGLGAVGGGIDVLDVAGKQQTGAFQVTRLVLDDQQIDRRQVVRAAGSGGSGHR